MFQKKPLIIGNMKVLSVIALGVFALGVLTFKSVTSLPKIKPTAAAPFNWQQFLPGGIAEKRAAAYPGDDASSAGGINAIYSAVPTNLPSNPMSPYLSLKQFLPVKPTIVPPFVDPNIFIGKKAALLNNLFGSGVAPASTQSFIPPWVSGGIITSPSFFTEKKTTFLGTKFDNPSTDIASSSLDSKRALSEPEPEPSISAQPRLVVGPPSFWGPPAAVAPTVKPTIVPPGYWSPFAPSSDSSSAAGPISPVVDPSVFFDKKTKFLNELFSSLSASTSTPEVSVRAVVPDDSTADSTTKSTGVPPSFWLQFIPAFASPPPPTVKPTIVPPGFWIPTTINKPVGLFGPPVPVVDPSQFVDKKTAFLNTLFKTLNITVTPAPVTTPEPTSDPVTAYEQRVADFLDKLFTAIINNGSDDATVAKRALETGNLNDLLGEIDEIKDSAAKSENEIGTRSAEENSPLARRTIGKCNDTTCTTAPQLPVDALLTAKDKVVDTIITEMGGIKNNILETLAELLAKQKEAAATPPPTPASKKKPGPPFGPGGPFGIGGPFGPWGAAAATTTTPKPTPDPAPFQKKVEFLGQVFDTLTQLEKDVTDALNQAVIDAAEAAASATTTTTVAPTTPETKSTSQIKNGTSLIDLIRSKLIELANSTEPSQTSGQATLTQQVPKYARAIKPFIGKPMLPSPAPTIVDPSFWIPDAAVGAPVGPDYYIGKTQSFLSKLFASKAATAGDGETDIANKVRSIKMAVHQGYQSLPPGSEELLQAGGGSTPQKHEGGGLKLQGDNLIHIPSTNEGGLDHHRHHNHHNRD